MRYIQKSLFRFTSVANRKQLSGMISAGSTFNSGDFTAINAFFWSSLDLSPYAGTDLGSTPYYIEVLDGAGKKATGYIGAVGAGEGLDDERLTNNDFASAEPPGVAWTRGAGWTVTGGVGVGVATNEYILQSVNPTTIGTLYKVVIELVTRTAGYISAFFDGIQVISVQTIPAVYSVYRNAALAASNFTIYGSGLFAGTIDNTSIKKVLDPPSTAVHIVKTLNGTTRDWASIESGFDPNTIASWIIYG